MSKQGNAAAAGLSWDQPCLTHDALVLRTLWLNCVRIFHREKERMRCAQTPRETLNKVSLSTGI